MKLEYKINHLSKEDVATFIKSDDMTKNFDIISNKSELLLKEKRKFVDRRISISVKFDIASIESDPYMRINIASFELLYLKSQLHCRF